VVRLTPTGPAGIAVVRLCGPDAPAILRTVFRPRRPSDLQTWPEQQLRFGRIVDGDETVDEAIVAVRPSPAGGTCVDLSIHGGRRVTERVIELLGRHGARILPAQAAWADAWPAKSYLHREAYALMPEAQTRRAAAWLLRQPELLREALESIRRCAREDVPSARERIRDLLATFGPAQRMLYGFRAAIIGPPNAGKSTLANALCGRHRILVSDTPGTTRDYVTEPAAIQGVPVTLVDTAGLRQTTDPVEREAVRRALDQAAEADLRLIVVDGSVAPGRESLECLEAFPPLGRELLVVNKCDLGGAFDPEAFSAWRGAYVRVSAARGDGLENLGRRMLETWGIGPEFDRRAAVFTGRQCVVLGRGAGPLTDREGLTEILDEVLGPGEEAEGRA